MGFTDEQIEEIQQGIEAQLDDRDEGDDDDDDDEDDDGLFGVWPENWDAAQIFLRLNLDRQVDQGLTIYTGVSTQEIERWLGLMQIDPAAYVDTIDSVQVMVRTACQGMNRRTAEGARRHMERERARANNRRPARRR